MSRKINVHTLSLFARICGFSFTVVCGFQCVTFQAQKIELTPSDVTYAHGELARQVLSIIFQPTMATLVFNVIWKSGKHYYLITGGTSTPRQLLTHHPPCSIIGPPPRPALAAERAVEGPKVFSVLN